MNSNKELFKLARQYVMLVDLYARARLDSEELKVEMNKIRNIILEKGYDIDKFTEYKNLYRKMTTEEYYKFIETL